MRAKLVITLLALGLFSRDSGLALPAENARESASPPAVHTPAASGDRSSAQVYPYVFRKAGYLATMGPLPMRFGPPSPSGNERTPPRVPFANKKPELSLTAEEMARTEAIESYRSVHGRTIPVPSGASPGGARPPGFMEQGNISTGSNEVLEFFQLPAPEPDVQKRQNRFLLDPLPPFSAAQPPAAGTQPPSRATFQKN